MVKRLLAMVAANLLVISSPSVIKAQMGDLDPALMHNALTNIFGAHEEFSAVAEAQVQDATLPMTIPLGICRSGDKLRIYMDFSKMMAGMSPAIGATLKAQGTDRIFNILRFDKGVAWRIYPGVQGYHEDPLNLTTNNAPDAQSALAALKSAKWSRTAVGQETIAGHPCVKQKLTARDTKEETAMGYLWLAKDLKEFPVQIELSGAITLKLTNIKLVKQNPKLFEIPDGYKKYANIAELAEAARQKRPVPAVTPVPTQPTRPPPSSLRKPR